MIRSGSFMAADSVISTVTRSGIHPRRLQVTGDPLDRVDLPQLAGRQVEADLELEPAARHTASCRHSSIDHPVADRLDEAHLLGERDEVARRNETALSGRASGSAPRRRPSRR